MFTHNTVFQWAENQQNILTFMFFAPCIVT